jgi:hypothetical protein
MTGDIAVSFIARRPPAREDRLPPGQSIVVIAVLSLLAWGLLIGLVIGIIALW